MSWLHKFFWIYGTVEMRFGLKIARKHRFNKNVQFVLHKAGTHGHKKDYWIDFDSYWWPKFVRNKKTPGCKPSVYHTASFYRPPEVDGS